MTRPILTSSLLTILTSLLTSSLVAPAARAESPAEPARRGALAPIEGGLEITVGVGVARSEGDLGDAMDAGDVVGSAAEIQLQLGSRISPNLAVSFYASAQDRGDGSDADRSIHTGAAGLAADLHLRPASAADPWISVGTGLRALMTRDDAGTSLLVGAELVRLQLGVDLRVDDHIAIAPVIGASATLYGAERTPMDGFSELSDKGIAWTFSAGLAARFDVLGAR